MQSSSKGETVLLIALSPKLYSIWYLPRVGGMKPQAYQLLLRLQITPFIYMDIFTWKKKFFFNTRDDYMYLDDILN